MIVKVFGTYKNIQIEQKKFQRNTNALYERVVIINGLRLQQRYQCRDQGKFDSMAKSLNQKRELNQNKYIHQKCEIRSIWSNQHQSLKTLSTRKRYKRTTNTTILTRLAFSTSLSNTSLAFELPTFSLCKSQCKFSCIKHVMLIKKELQRGKHF